MTRIKPVRNQQPLIIQALQLHQQGRLEDAASLCRAILRSEPQNFDALNLLGVIRGQQGRNTDAQPLLRSALKIRPTDARACLNYGMVLMQMSRPGDALQYFDKVVAQKPEFAEGYCNRGNALSELKRFNEALASYDTAIDLKRDYAEAYYNRGSCLLELDRLEDALSHFDMALAVNPMYVKALNNRAATLLRLKRLDEALASCDAALACKADHVEALVNRGIVLKELGRTEEALGNLNRARASSPESVEFAYFAELLLPAIPASSSEIILWRDRYRIGIERLMKLPTQFNHKAEKMNPETFFLAYHNIPNRPLMESLCRLFRSKFPALTYNAPHVRKWHPPSSSRRIKVGICSEFLCYHTIGKLYRGFIRHLDRARFELTVIHAPNTKRDDFRIQIDALAEKAIQLPTDRSEQQKMVAAEALDVLFYPDIGMAPVTYFLAYSRLAPVQAVSWGHPDSTGIDTVDYFISSDLLEPEAAASEYSERLILLHRLAYCYEPHVVPASILARADLGLPETGTLYGCPQTLFKFHPEFDSVLAEIACGDPDGHIVVLEGHSSAWAKLLRERWARTYPILADRVTFLPAVPEERFMMLLAHFDVLLDPIHFGSGNSFFESMVYGTPTVTWPGRFLRGRIAAGAYRQMEVENAPIVERLEDYAPLALALGRDKERSRQLREASVRAAARSLFADLGAVREFEAFLLHAVAAAGRREKLSNGWKAIPSSPTAA